MVQTSSKSKSSKRGLVLVVTLVEQEKGSRKEGWIDAYTSLVPLQLNRGIQTPEGMKQKGIPRDFFSLIPPNQTSKSDANVNTSAFKALVNMYKEKHHLLCFSCNNCNHWVNSDFKTYFWHFKGNKCWGSPTCGESWCWSDSQTPQIFSLFYMINYSYL